MGGLPDVDIEAAIAETDAKLEKAGVDPDAPATTEEGEEAGFIPSPTEDDGTKNDSTPGEGGEGSGEGEGSGKPAGNGDDDPNKGNPATPAAPATPATATDESGNAVVFKNAAELSKFVTDQLATINKAAVSPEDKKAAEDALKSVKFFDDDWKPKDWNEAVKALYPHIRKMIKEEEASEQAEHQKNQDEFMQKLDTEYDELASSGKIPARNTEDGKRVNRELAAVGSAYGLGSYKVAYDIWSKLPKGTEITLSNGSTVKVGAIDSGTPAAPAKKVNPSKAASRLISGNNNNKGGEGGKKKIEYTKIHGQSMDRLLQEDLS